MTGDEKWIVHVNEEKLCSTTCGKAWADVKKSAIMCLVILKKIVPWQND